MRPERRHPSPDPASDIQEMLQALLARQERIEAMLERIVPPLEPTPEPQSVPPLVQALAAVFGASGFTSREAWHRASSDPALWRAFQDAGITGTHHLGRWLGNHRSAGVERSIEERDGCLWHCDLRAT